MLFVLFFFALGNRWDIYRQEKITMSIFHTIITRREEFDDESTINCNVLLLMNLIRLCFYLLEHRHHHPALHSFSFSIYKSVQSITTCYIINYWLRKEKFNNMRTSKFLSDENYKTKISRSHRSFLSIICYLIVAISLLYIDNFTHSNRTIRIK